MSVSDTPWWFVCLGLLLALPVPAVEPVADVHLHYNWDQQELLDPAEAVERLDAAGVRLGVVSSVPAEHALLLSDQAPEWIVPLFSPYLEPTARWMWHARPGLLPAAQEAVASGRYRGLGELHLQPGIGPRRDDPVLRGLLGLAEEYDVPMLLHTDAASEQYFAALCEGYPAVRFLWAHAGGILTAEQVGRALEQCDNVWVELSARDPWRYDTLTDTGGALLPGWEELFSRFPDRFMIGSDPVWNVTRGQTWETADDGWDYLGRLWDYHRGWMASLPASLRRQLEWENARSFFAAE